MSMTIKKRPWSDFIELIAIGLVFVALARHGDTQEISIEEQELILQLTQQFAEAEALFEDPQRESQSIEFFKQIIDTIEDERRRREDVSEELVELQHQALELRARASFNAGQIQGATDDFRRLILDDPRYTLDQKSLSPKVIDFFEDLKKQLVGYVAVNSEPAGARVTVNGDFVGVTNFFPVEVLTGVARVRVTREGYQEHVDDQVRILPGEVVTLDVELVRNSAKLPIITQPSGVEVYVDGEHVGQTDDVLPDQLRSFVPPGYDPDQLSAPFELEALPLGSHTIELRRDCYAPVRVTFDANEARDYTPQIIKLEESIGQLTLTSNPSGGRVFLDGEYRGNTPLELSRVCSGTHHLEVKHPTGKYVESIDLGQNEALSLECPIRPSLAFLGLIADEPVSGSDLEEIRKKVTEELQTLTAMNVILPEPTIVEELVGPGGLWTLVVGDDKEDAPSRQQQVRDLSEKLGRELEVEALLLGYVPAQRLTKDVTFHFLAVGSSRPDVHTLNYLDREAMPSFVKLLGEATPLFGSWIGLASVDTRLHPGPTVLRVDPEGPAARAGIQMGDILLEVGGSPIDSTMALLEKVQAAEAGDALQLKLLRQGSESDVSVEVDQTPTLVPLNQNGYLYNKAIVNMRHRMVLEPAHESLARLNLALAHIQLGDYETALRDHLPHIVLDRDRGISRGTVLYYQGLCYLMLGENADAARMFEQALQYEGATLQSNDGPQITPLVQRRLREIGP